MPNSGILVAAGAGALGLGFLSYCIYFDRKRRSHPEFKKNLKERRRREAQERQKQTITKLPNMKDQAAIQRFFLSELQTGEALLSTGDIQGGVTHLANSVAVCGQPDQLLQVLQETIPPPVFQLLVQALPAVRMQIMAASASSDMNDLE